MTANEHPARRIVLKSAEIDVDAIPLVQWVNSFEGAFTLMSCQGNPSGDRPGSPHLLFFCWQEYDLYRIERVFKRFGAKVTRIQCLASGDKRVFRVSWGWDKYSDMPCAEACVNFARTVRYVSTSARLRKHIIDLKAVWTADVPSRTVRGSPERRKDRRRDGEVGVEIRARRTY